MKVKRNTPSTSECMSVSADIGYHVENLVELPQLSRTLLIPLAARAGENVHPAPIIRDEKAAKLLEQIDISGMTVDGGAISTLGILARTRIIDEEVRKLLPRSSSTVMINLGAGLDTRIFRIQNPSIRWIDIDLPEVIALRRRLIGEPENTLLLGRSVLSRDWTQEAKVTKQDQVIVVAEGLLMYFTEEKVRKLFQILYHAYPSAHILFDVVHPYFINKKISSEFLWGLEKDRDIESYHDRLHLVQSWSMGNLWKERQPPLLRLLNILPNTRNRSQILHCEFCDKEENVYAQIP